LVSVNNEGSLPWEKEDAVFPAMDGE
jgi:hypothetical protein